MGYFNIYADESGKLAQSDYTSFCGYVGHASEWERVSSEWNSVRLAWGVPPLHMRCVMFPDRSGCDRWAETKEQWGEAWEAKRDRMLAQFAHLILYCNLACVGSVVDSAHFRSMPDSRFKRQHKDPVFLSFYTLLMESLDKVDRVDKCLSVSLIIDDEAQYGMECYRVLNELKETFPRVRNRVSALTLGNDAVYPGLQIADMIAYEARARMVAKLADQNIPPTSRFVALTRMGVHQPKLWTAEYLDIAANNIDEKANQS